MKRVVIIGAGFGGLRAARDLHGQGFEVWLIDRQNYHLFQPLLYQVATASLEQEAIVHPVRAAVRGWDDVTFRLGEVNGIDLEERFVHTVDGARIGYDHLVVAAGAATNFLGLESVEANAQELKTLDHAVALRNRVLRLFERAALTEGEERRALLTFVVVGGGPTGVEFAGALAELVNNALHKDFPEMHTDEARILLIEMLDGVLPPYPRKLRDYTKRQLERKGVEVMLGRKVVYAGPEHVELDDGTVIAAHTLLWMAGVKPVELADDLPGERGRGGRVVVNPDLTLPGHPEISVIGDIAYVEDRRGEPLPQMAPVAIQMGAYVAKHLTAQARGEEIEPFRYSDKGRMAVIGRGRAVAQVFGVKLAGIVAWLAWLTLHLFWLIDFRNRLVVLLNWAYDYLAFERKVRIITGEAQTAWQNPYQPIAVDWPELDESIEMEQVAPVEE